MRKQEAAWTVNNTWLVLSYLIDVNPDNMTIQWFTINDEKASFTLYAKEYQDTDKNYTVGRTSFCVYGLIQWKYNLFTKNNLHWH